MGGKIEREPFDYMSDCIWFLDTECIEDHGDYIEILNNISRISKGVLTFEKLHDFIDIDKSDVWVSFDFQGNSYKWDLEINDDWLDSNILLKTATLLEQENKELKLVYYQEGQALLITICTQKQLEALNELTEMNFKYIKNII